MKEKQLVCKLILNGYTIASAESCTAGKFAATIVNVPDASKVINSSIVTYSNEAKQKYCGVKTQTLQKFGAVSEETTNEMCSGIATECNANVGVAISGIAGPKGATPTKPVGTVCFGFCINGHITTCTMHFKGGRQSVRKKSVNFAINKLLKLI